MIKMLTVNEVIEILKKAPEQCIFDWKRDLNLGKDESKKSEFVKDVVAIANATTYSPGFIFYGVDPTTPDYICGMSNNYDDANLQQLMNGKVEPEIKFIYYEISYGANIIGIVQIEPSVKRPHIITRDYGNLREGQILIRRGSSTGGIKRQDLLECFYGKTSPYSYNVIKKLGFEAQLLQAQTNYLKESQEQEDRIVREMESIVGLPPGSIGNR